MGQCVTSLCYTQCGCPGHGAGEMLQAFLQRAQVQGLRCLSDLKFFYSHLACLPWVTSCLVPNFLCHLGVISLSLSLFFVIDKDRGGAYNLWVTDKAACC